MFFVSWEIKFAVCCCLGSSSSIQADDATREEAAGISSECWTPLTNWLTKTKESIAGRIELKEKQWESNFTGLLITRLVFQTLCILTGWRGVKAG